MKQLIIATRGSQLALAQANWVRDTLMAAHPGLEVSLSIIKTKGDKILDAPLAKVGGKGLFVKEIEDALLSGAAGLAVHSMKDMPAEMPEGLCIAAVSQREDARDVLVSNHGGGLSALPAGARVGTSSLRRGAQAKAVRPDIELVSIRGNVPTRLRKLAEDNLDGVILAAAGIRRLGLAPEVLSHIEPDQMLPAVGQGALALETREDDDQTRALLACLHHQDTADATVCERAFLARLEGGCQGPIAGHATVAGGQVHMSGLVAGLDGVRVIKKSGRADRAGAAALGVELAEEILAAGGGEILQEVYGEALK